VWPDGFTTDGVTVYDGQRHLAAFTGDTVSVSGGYGALPIPDPCGRTEQAWQVTSVVHRAS
jgi:hypothetical protein